jgi:hypothetical protein
MQPEQVKNVIREDVFDVDSGGASLMMCIREMFQDIIWACDYRDEEYHHKCGTRKRRRSPPRFKPEIFRLTLQHVVTKAVQLPQITLAAFLSKY